MDQNKNQRKIEIKISLNYQLTQSLIQSTINIKSLQNRLLKVCYVPATSAGRNRLLFLRPLTVLMKQTMQTECAVK